MRDVILVIRSILSVTILTNLTLIPFCTTRTWTISCQKKLSAVEASSWKLIFQANYFLIHINKHVQN